jgi:hypothetical protein
MAGMIAAHFAGNVFFQAMSKAALISCLVNRALGQSSKNLLRRGFPARSLRMSSSTCLHILRMSAEVSFLNFMMTSYMNVYSVYAAGAGAHLR